MPAGDRTGPFGAGPMTGRGVGLCGGSGMPGHMNRRSGGWYCRGAGRGGRGRGFRHWFYATGIPGWFRFGGSPYASVPSYTGDDEVKILKEQADYFKRALDDVSARISELQKGE